MSRGFPIILPFSVGELHFVDASARGKQAEGDLYRESRARYTQVLEARGDFYDGCENNPGCEMLQFNFRVTRQAQPYGMWTIHNCRIEGTTTSPQVDVLEIKAWPGPAFPYESPTWQEDCFAAMAYLLRTNLVFETNGRTQELDIVEWNFPKKDLLPGMRWNLMQHPNLRSSLLDHRGAPASALDFEESTDGDLTYPRHFRRKR